MRRIGILLCLGLGAAPLLEAQSPFGRISTSHDAILVDGAPLFLKGVCYSPSIGGDGPGAFNNVNFRDDMLEIRDVLHANAVRVYDAMPEQFYREARDAGLFVIQGIFIPDSEAAGAVTPLWLKTDAFVAAQKQHITDVVRRVNESGAEDAIIAYVIGSGLSSDSIRRTIESEANQAAPRFTGTRYAVPPSTPIPPANSYAECGPPALTAFPDPHPFQSFIAELAEHLADVDERNGIARHLIGYANVPRTSSFLGARDRPAPVFDLPVTTGFLDVIFENVFSYDQPYTLYRGFSSYIERLKTAHPDKPVVLLETGYSTSPTALPPWQPLCGLRSPTPQPLHFQFGGVSEADQARGLEARWVDTITSRRPLAGFFVFEFYDEWWLGGNPAVQDDQPLEHFGLKRVVRNGNTVTSQPKPAHAKLAELFGCEGVGPAASSCGLAITSGPLLEATYGLPVAPLALAAAGGTAPFTWEILPPDDLAPGALPLGVSLDPGGAFSGTPERVGDFRLRIGVEDSGSPRLESERVVVLRVHPPVFSTRGRELLMNGQPYFLKGIDYSPFICGEAPWSAALKANPYEDMEVIAGTLHANAIRVYQSLPWTVYDAARKNGLFVIQGIHIQIEGPSPGDPNACRSATFDLLERGFVENTKKHALAELDEVHAAGGGDTVLCWVVGNEMNFCAQRHTILKHEDSPYRYEGTFYSTPTELRLPCVNTHDRCPSQVESFHNPHAVQSFVAELVDAVAVREFEAHGERRLMAHATDPNTSVAVCSRDRFEPELHLPVDMGFLDIVFQNVYSYFPPALRYLGYQEYLEECARAYPDTPFVILECGYSVSPEVDMPGCAAGPICGQPMLHKPNSYCFGHNTESQQAQGLVAQWKAATSAPGLVSGFFVFEYFDEWWKGHLGSEWIHEPNKGEEWFGLIEVGGTPEACEMGEMERRPAFDAVASMFAEDVLGTPFRRGDANHDGAVNITDGIAALNILFLGAPETPCPDALDSDDSRAFNITDPIYLLNHLFIGGPAPPSPGIESCGSDATDPQPSCVYPAGLCSS